MDVARSTKIGLLNRGRSQKWLASQLGVTKSYVSAVCCGRNRPGWDNTQRIADALEYSLSDFIKLGEQK